MSIRSSRRLLLFAAMASIVFVTCADTSAKVRPGSKAPEFSLKDGTGTEYVLSRERKDRFVVVIFMGTHCPASNGYNQRMTELYRDYAQKGVSLFGINSNTHESPGEILEHARKHDFQFPVLKDLNNVVADAYGAQVTPEAFVIDGKGTLRYHGRIDDDPRGTNITSRDLRAALDALLAGKEIPVSETRVFGCGIDRMKGKE